MLRKGLGIMGGRQDGSTFCWYAYRLACIDVLQIYKMESVGPDAPEYISWMAMDGDAVWAASGIYAIRYFRGKEVRGLPLSI